MQIIILQLCVSVTNKNICMIQLAAEPSAFTFPLAAGIFRGVEAKLHTHLSHQQSIISRNIAAQDQNPFLLRRQKFFCQLRLCDTNKLFTSSMLDFPADFVTFPFQTNGTELIWKSNRLHPLLSPENGTNRKKKNFHFSPLPPKHTGLEGIFLGYAPGAGEKGRYV